MPPRVFLNLVYAWLVREADSEERQRIDGALYAPADGGNEMANLLSNVLTEDGG
jgi:hypothetical protein